MVIIVVCLVTANGRNKRNKDEGDNRGAVEGIDNLYVYTNDEINDKNQGEGIVLTGTQSIDPMYAKVESEKSTSHDRNITIDPLGGDLGVLATSDTPVIPTRMKNVEGLTYAELDLSLNVRHPLNESTTSPQSRAEPTIYAEIKI